MGEHDAGHPDTGISGRPGNSAAGRALTEVSPGDQLARVFRPLLASSV